MHARGDLQNTSARFRVPQLILEGKVTEAGTEGQRRRDGHRIGL